MGDYKPQTIPSSSVRSNKSNAETKEPSEDKDGREYFVLNPGRASALFEEDGMTHLYDSLAKVKDSPAPYMELHQDPGTVEQGGAGDAGNTSHSAYEPVDVKEEGREYFVLNPGRASALLEPEEEDGVSHLYDSLVRESDNAAPYLELDQDPEPPVSAAGNAPVDVGGTAGRGVDTGYEPVTVKDDATGGYQFVDGDLFTPVPTVDDHLSNPSNAQATSNYEEISLTSPNAPQQHDNRMMDNILYKPMNGEKMIDNVLYKPMEG